ncbi:MAG: hypothetical protein OEZ58_02985 [Gammaproteobacteria bacterium]|nr:hypothetical protein [Gammaproteobacteria bacterium]MDH5727929.1 hypothetical protein [Gammaproteobacteria bacterium]
MDGIREKELYLADDLLRTSGRIRLFFEIEVGRKTAAPVDAAAQIHS